MARPAEREHEVLFQPLTKEHIRNLAGMLKSPTSATAELLKRTEVGQRTRGKEVCVVLDNFAVLAFLFAEPGHEKVLAVLEKAADTDSDLLIAAPNWAEVRYIVERKVGLAKWREV